LTGEHLVENIIKRRKKEKKKQKEDFTSFEEPRLWFPGGSPSSVSVVMPVHERAFAVLHFFLFF
jgi:hypothetical protein